MEITVTQEQGRVPVTVLHLNGRLDAASYKTLQDRATESINNGARHLLLDLSRVPYVSSAGIRALNHIYAAARVGSPEEDNVTVGKKIAEGDYVSANLKLLQPTPNVVEALKMAGLDMFLEIHRNLKQAVDSF